MKKMLLMLMLSLGFFLPTFSAKADEYQQDNASYILNGVAHNGVFTITSFERKQCNEIYKGRFKDSFVYLVESFIRLNEVTAFFII
jgi:hypothetical protein